jgi:hypothetical protein
MPSRSTYVRVCSLAVCVLLAASAFAQVVRYDEHRVVQAQVANEAQLEQLLSMTDDVWSHRVGIGAVDVRVSPAQFELLKTSGIQYRVLIKDVQALIDKQAAQRGVADGPWDDYMDYAQVLAHVDSLVALRPDLASTFVLGQTLEGRDIVGLRITGPGGGPKPGVLYHSGTHAREWITVAVNLYFADQIIRNYDTDPYVQELVDRCEFFIIPVFNVDGYLYTWGPDRMWRKNRRPISGGNCDGVDLNRNFSVGWGGPGSSGDPCGQTYRGASAFSEPETQAMRDFVLAHPHIVTYHDIHSYGQLLMWPWGYQPTLPPDQAFYEYIGTNMSELISAVHGRYYEPGPVYSTIYPASGVTVDWAYGDAGALAFTFELRGNPGGFLLPPDQILPNCEEIFPALLFQAEATSVAVRIAFPEGLPAIVNPDGSTTLRVVITDGSQTVDPNGATLHVRSSPAGAFTVHPIAHQGGDEFLATFPPRGCGEDTEYYITARGDAGGVVTSPHGAPGALYSARVGTLTVLFHDNFEQPAGWTVENQNLSTGAWTREVPIPPTRAPEPPGDYDGSGKCWVTGNTPNEDVDGGPTILTSSVFDLSGASDPEISYARWVATNDPANDQLVVEVSDDDGVTWTTVDTFAGAGGWNVHAFRVRDFVTITAQMRLRFSIADQPNNSVTEAGIDALRISEFTCGGCAGDLNGDGRTDLTDLGILLADFGCGPPGLCVGDLNGDGLTDLADLGILLADFGCAP